MSVNFHVSWLKSSPSSPKTSHQLRSGACSSGSDSQNSFLGNTTAHKLFLSVKLPERISGNWLYRPTNSTISNPTQNRSQRNVSHMAYSFVPHSTRNSHNRQRVVSPELHTRNSHNRQRVVSPELHSQEFKFNTTVPLTQYVPYTCVQWIFQFT